MTADEHELCGRCGRVVNEHTVGEWRTCLSDLHDHILPFEAMPETQQTLDMVMAGSIVVKAAVHDSPIGAFPVLVFEFTTPEGPLAPIGLMLDSTHMRSVRHLIGQSIDAALTAARRRRSA